MEEVLRRPWDLCFNGRKLLTPYNIMGTGKAAGGRQPISRLEVVWQPFYREVSR